MEKDLNRRVVTLETKVKRIDMALVQLLDVVRGVGGLTIGLISVLLSGSMRAGAKPELEQQASTLAKRLDGESEKS